MLFCWLCNSLYPPPSFEKKNWEKGREVAIVFVLAGGGMKDADESKDNKTGG